MGLFRKAKQFLKGDSTAYQSLVRGSAISMALRLVGQGVNYGLVFVITRLFGANGFGAYSIFQAVMQFFTQTARLGYDTLLMRNSAQSQSEQEEQVLRSQYQSALRVTTILSLLLSVLLFFSAPFLAEHFFSKPHLTFYFRCAAFCLLPLVHINIYASYLKGKKRFREFNFIQQVSLLLFTLLFVLALFAFFHVARITAAAYLISCLITLSISFVWYRKYFKVPALTVTADWKLLAYASLTFFVVGMMNYLRNATETIILGYHFTEDYAGIFKASQKISSVISFTLFSTIVAAAPHFATLYKENKTDELRRTVQKTTALLFWTALPVFLILLLFPEFILQIFGKEFTRGRLALTLMCAGQFFNTTMGPANNLLLMANRQRLVLYISLINNMVCATAGWFIIPVYGIEGAAFVNLMGILIPNLAAISFIKYHFGFFTFNPYMLNKVFTK